MELIAPKDRRNVRNALLGLIVLKSHPRLWFVQLEIIARLARVSAFSVKQDIIVAKVQELN